MNLSKNQATILIVDDNPTNLRVLVDYLDQAGFQTLVATDGERAIQQVRLFPPDLILLDIMMPGLDGFETCRQLKANVTTQDIPIIFMTALTDTSHKVKGFKVGAVDYITKPFEQPEVMARIKTHLTIQRQRQELQRLNRSLQEVNNALQEANITKDKFFSIVAHDMKNSFGMLFNYSELVVAIAEEINNPDLSETSHHLYEAAKKTATLLENLLEWSRLQRRVMIFDPQDIDLFQVITESVDLFGGLANQKNIELQHSLDLDTYFGYVDQNMIYTVLRNLINNALKFTPSGGQVDLSARFQGEFVELSVRDTGIGIEPDHLADLFKLDRKHTTYGTEGEKGTGLGLTLCKEMVERNGGQIWVESQVDQGTTVYFTLPKGKPVRFE